eukprot:1194469-Prorocentrum_minimum.AAC.6
MANATCAANAPLVMLATAHAKHKRSAPGRRYIIAPVVYGCTESSWEVTNNESNKNTCKVNASWCI